jgi:hypothetical protein
MTMFPEIEAFATPKPESLLERIIHVGSAPGETVVDFFAGSGTTAAVAHKMRRRWIAIERSAATAAAFTVPRLARVVHGTDPGGITESVAWRGGGQFVVGTVGNASDPVLGITQATEFSAIQAPKLSATEQKCARDVPIQPTFFDDEEINANTEVA